MRGQERLKALDVLVQYEGKVCVLSDLQRSEMTSIERMKFSHYHTADCGKFVCDEHRAYGIACNTGGLELNQALLPSSILRTSHRVVRCTRRCPSPLERP